MTTNAPQYSRGDWIVHRIYGVGQVVDLEEKRLHKEVTRFYKVRTTDSIFWLPVDSAANGRVEPLPSRRKLKEAIAVLKNPPREMSMDSKERKRRIDSVKSEGSLIAIARLIRDLTFLTTLKNLTVTEQRALKLMTERLLKVWSVCLDVEVEQAKSRLNRILLTTLESNRAEST